MKPASKQEGDVVVSPHTEVSSPVTLRLLRSSFARLAVGMEPGHDAPLTVQVHAELYWRPPCS